METCLICTVVGSTVAREPVGTEAGIEMCHFHRLDYREGKLASAALFQAEMTLKAKVKERDADPTPETTIKHQHQFNRGPRMGDRTNAIVKRLMETGGKDHKLIADEFQCTRSHVSRLNVTYLARAARGGRKVSEEDAG
jgi:hypothetical protein